MTRFVYLLLFSLSFTYLFLGIKQPVGRYDEGLIVYGAAKILDGSMPYRDFWTIYPPGQFYVISAVFKIFGTSIIFERIYDIIVRSLLAIVIFFIAARTTSKKVALFVWLLVSLILGMPDSFGNATEITLLLCFASVILFFRFFRLNSKILLFSSGFLIGLGGIFRSDLAFYCFLSNIVVLSWYTFSKFTKLRFLDKLRQSVRFGTWFVVGSLIPIAFFGSYLLARVPVKVLFADLIIFPFTIYPGVRHLPLFLVNTYINDLIFPELLFCVLVYGLGLVSIYKLHLKLWKWPLKNNEVWEITLLILLGIFFFTKAIIRLDEVHLMPAAIMAVLVGAVIGFKLNKANSLSLSLSLKQLTVMVLFDTSFANCEYCII